MAGPPKAPEATPLTFLMVDDKQGEFMLWSRDILDQLMGQKPRRESISALSFRTSRGSRGSFSSRRTSSDPSVESEMGSDYLFKIIEPTLPSAAASTFSPPNSLYQSGQYQAPEALRNDASRVLVSQYILAQLVDEKGRASFVRVQCIWVNQGQLARHLLQTGQIRVPDVTLMDQNIEGSIEDGSGYALASSLLDEGYLKKVVYSSTSPTTLRDTTEPFYKHPNVHMLHHYDQLLLLNEGLTQATSSGLPSGEVLEKLHLALELSAGFAHPTEADPCVLKSLCPAHFELSEMIAQARQQRDADSRKTQLLAMQTQLKALLTRLAEDCKASAGLKLKRILFRALQGKLKPIAKPAPKPDAEPPTCKPEKTAQAAGAGTPARSRRKKAPQKPFLPFSQIRTLAEQRVAETCRQALAARDSDAAVPARLPRRLPQLTDSAALGAPSPPPAVTTNSTGTVVMPQRARMLTASSAAQPRSLSPHHRGSPSPVPSKEGITRLSNRQLSTTSTSPAKTPRRVERQAFTRPPKPKSTCCPLWCFWKKKAQKPSAAADHYKTDNGLD